MSLMNNYSFNLVYSLLKYKFIIKDIFEKIKINYQ